MKLTTVAQLGFLAALIAVAFNSQAIEEVIVYGQRVPVGFHEYTLGLQMTETEFKSLYTSNYNTQGISPLAHYMLQWNNRCGGILGNLEKARTTCKTLVGDHHQDMLKSCALAANSPKIDFSVSINHKFLGGTLTWIAPDHQYAACADQADSRHGSLLELCSDGFVLAKHAQRDCRGAGGW